jgi:hypothetical protein
VSTSRRELLLRLGIVKLSLHEPCEILPPGPTLCSIRSALSACEESLASGNYSSSRKDEWLPSCYVLGAAMTRRQLAEGDVRFG